jgi:hypothetical protein
MVTYTVSGNTNVFSTTQNFTNNVFTFQQRGSFSQWYYTVTILNIVSASSLEFVLIVPTISGVVAD